MTTNGEAYGFLYYNGTTQRIIDELADARNISKTPELMGFDLVSQVDQIDTSNDSALADIVGRAKAGNMSHVIKASMPNAGNRRVAGLLCNVMSDLGVSPLYQQGEPYCADVVYKRGNQYIFDRD